MGLQVEPKKEKTRVISGTKWVSGQGITTQHAAYGEVTGTQATGTGLQQMQVGSQSQQPAGRLSGRQMQVQCAGGRVLESRTTPRLNAMSN